jgi:hypothetical protein
VYLNARLKTGVPCTDKCANIESAHNDACESARAFAKPERKSADGNSGLRVPLSKVAQV